MDDGSKIRESLRRRRVELVSHTTPCDRLPGIFRHGGLFSWNQRQLRGVPEPEAPHGWGTSGKKEALADHVICSFMPPWWMCRAHEEELAIVLLDAEVVCCQAGVAFCPHNSAYNLFPAEDIPGWLGIGYFDACFMNPDTYLAGDSEILVPGLVPLVDFRGIVFCDREAYEYWGNQINEAYVAATPQAPLPAQGLQSYAGRTPDFRFRFPGDWSPTRRLRP